ncbi:hypothetical protein Q5M85_05880 [Paraclostridium bifermentans]|nr:hypothetical protein [Paraclostridium bifermentans]
MCIYDNRSKYISKNTYTTYYKKIIEDNDLRLISFDEEKNYYISEEESIAYKIEPNYNNLSDLSKYTLSCEKHTLDPKKGDKVNSTVMYIIVDEDKLLGISCEPNGPDKK